MPGRCAVPLAFRTASRLTPSSAAMPAVGLLGVLGDGFCGARANADVGVAGADWRHAVVTGSSISEEM